MQAIPKPFIYVLFFALLLGLYYPSLNGQPIFDDYHYIFNDPVITENFSYWTIFRDFAWPVSVSAEKLLFKIWGNEYFYYHLLNVVLHFLNSFLLLKLLKKLDVPLAHYIFLLFLVHPSNVISVSWMVQLKTLLCFSFGVISIFCLLKSFEEKRFYALSYLAFLFSVLSKSASVPLSLLLCAYAYKKKGKKVLLWMIPFLLISGYSTYKVLKSEVTTNAELQINSKSFVAVQGDNSHALSKPQPQTPSPQAPATENSEKNLLRDIKDRASTFLKTSHFYFWQALLPLENYPIKGQGPKGIGFTPFFHLGFIIVLIILNWGSLAGLCLIGGYLMLAPFLNIFTASYMTITWVSEQHIYLALPFLICFWVGLLSKWKLKYAQVIPFLFLVFFIFQTSKTVFYYNDEVIFYSKSLEADPYNLPIAYNLAVTYLKRNDPNNALAVTGKIIGISGSNPAIRASKYFPYISELHGEIVRLNLKKP